MSWEHDYNPSTKEAESERSQSKDSIDSIRPCLKKQTMEYVMKLFHIYLKDLKSMLHDSKNKSNPFWMLFSCEYFMSMICFIF